MTERADAHFVECMPFPAITADEIAEIEGIEGSETPSTYKYTYISESNFIYGVPENDHGVALLYAGDARDVGGGIVGLPFYYHPFASGQTIIIGGTTNYEGAHVLTAGTSANELQFADTYVAETFDGTETVLRYIAAYSITGIANIGRMAVTSGGDVYWAHNWKVDPGTAVTKFSFVDDSITQDFLTWPHDTYDTVITLSISDDDAYLYVMTDGPQHLIKFDLSDGSEVWHTGFGEDPSYTFNGFEMSIDADGNCYTCETGSHLSKPICQFDADTGALNYTYTETGEVPNLNLLVTKYENIVDDDMGIVISGGRQYCSTTSFASYDAQGYMNNMWVRTLDNSAGDKIRVKGAYVSGSSTYTYLIGTGCIAVYDGYIYVLISILGEEPGEVYKYQWDGSSCNLIDTFYVCPYAIGIYFDPWGNLVVVNSLWDSANQDILYYYDTEGTEITHIDNLASGMLSTWDGMGGGVGGSWLQGDVYFVGDIESSTTDSTNPYKYWASGNYIYGLGHLIGETVCILADGVVYPSRIVADNGAIDRSDFLTATNLHIGLNYESKLRPMKPLSQLDMMAKKATCKQMGLSFHNTDDTEGRSTDIADTGVRYGVRDDDMKQIDFNDAQWKNKCEIDGLFTGSVAVSVPDGFSVNLPLQIITDSPLPCVVRAMIPKVDVGD